MIDPVHSLAFSIQANPGVYALILGSGVSRPAKIPTGWEITLDLVRKLAVLHGETNDLDPEGWYRGKYDEEANYSIILDALTKTPSERQQLLRPYIEPNDQEREDGEKQPTLAHHAIAALAAKGFIRVIITTNFDRLMERALEEAGIVPKILSSPDQVQGALPLIHTECCVLKVHGDYLDTRIRNTPDELDEYPDEFNQFLDRVFDEFGLIVCGWSAEWDSALRQAIYRASSRRFTTYWAVRGEPSDEAQRLINHRSAQALHIEDADTFFQTIHQYVESIEEYSKPHPLSTDAAVASLKRYISDPRYRIQLSDLVDKTVERVVESTSGDSFLVQGGPTPTSESVTERVRSYEAASSTLLAMATVGGYWAEEEHHHVWRRALERLGSNTSSSGNVLWLDLQRYPATLLLYALGLGAVEANRLQFLGLMLAITLGREYQEDLVAAQMLPPFCWSAHGGGGQRMQILEGMAKHYAPLNDWMQETLRPYTESIISADKRYTLVFDKLEILMALSCAYQESRISSQASYWVPLGAFVYRGENRIRIPKEIKESLAEMGNESPFVMSKIFGETAEHCAQALKALEQYISELGLYFR